MPSNNADNPYQWVSARISDARFVSGAPVSDFGDSRALVRAPQRKDATQLEVRYATLNNMTGGTNTVGLAMRLPTYRWAAGTLTAAGAYTDATAAAQNSTTADLVLHAGASSGSGILIGAQIPFNIVDILQSTAGDQVAPVFILEVWDGTQWLAITTGIIQAPALIPGAVGERLLAFLIPGTWVKGGSGAGVPQTLYNARLRHTNGGAGTVNSLASQIFVGVSIGLMPNVAIGAVTLFNPPEPVRAAAYGDALFPLFATAHAQNMCDVQYRFV